MKTSPALLALALTLMPAASTSATRGPYDPSADAARDLRDAGARAAKAGKRVLALVGGNWCGWCRALDGLMQTDAKVKASLAKYEVVYVNWSRENRNEAVMAKLGEPNKLGFPALVVLSPKLEVLHLQETGNWESTTRPHDPEKVIAFLEEWAKPRKAK